MRAVARSVLLAAVLATAGCLASGAPAPQFTSPMSGGGNDGGGGGGSGGSGM